MTNISLAQSYLTKARVRLRILPVLLDADAFSDVIRESQEVVELALKGMLRQVGIDPPHWHDVGSLLREYASRFEAASSDQIDRLATASAWLRKEREFSFYGDVDFIPTEQYTRDAAERGIADAEFAVAIAARVIIVR